MENMKRIESKEDLIKWARAVNQGLTIKQKCDFQDIYAHSKEADLKEFFIEAKGERSLIVCSINNVMAYETVEKMLLYLARHKAETIINKELEEHDERYRKRFVELEKREAIFEEGKRAIYKRIRELTNIARIHKERGERLGEELDSYRKENREYRRRLAEQAEQAHTIKALKQLLKED